MMRIADEIWYGTPAQLLRFLKMRSGNFPRFLKMSEIFKNGVRAYYGGTAGTCSGPRAYASASLQWDPNLDKKYPAGGPNASQREVQGKSVGITKRRQLCLLTE